MSLSKVLFIASSLILMSPLCAMLRVDKFNGPKKNQISTTLRDFKVPYDEQEPDKYVVKRPSQERWEKTAKHIHFTQNAPAEIQKRILSHVFVTSDIFKNTKASELLLIMNPEQAAKHLERATKLAGNKKTCIAADVYFLLNRNQQQMLYEMNRHFSQDGITNIPVTRQGWLTIQSLPEDIKCEYKNKKEFFTAELMRDNTDKAIFVTSQALQEGLKGAAVGFGAGYVVTGISLLKEAAPEISKTTFEKTNNKSMTDFGQSLQQGLNGAHNWLQQQTDSLEEKGNLSLKYGVEAFKETRKAVVHNYIKTGIAIAQEETTHKTKEMCVDNFNNPQVLSTTIEGFGFGLLKGVGQGLLDMDKPIQKESISKI